MADNRILALILLLASMPAQAGYMEKAQSHLDHSRLDAAVIELKNALQEDPDNLAARFLLADVYLRKQSGSAAEKEINRGRELGAERAEWVPRYLKALILQNQYKELMREVEPEAGDPPELKARIHARRAQILTVQGKPAQAEEELAQARATGVDDELIDATEARLHMLRGEWEKARSLLSRLLAREDIDIESLLVAGQLYRIEGPLDKALRVYRRALDSNPNHIGARLGEITVLVRLRKTQQARERLAVLQRRRPNLPMAHHLLAMVEWQEGNAEAAKERLQRVLAAAPHHAPSHLLIGTVYYNLGELEAAKAHLSRFLTAVKGHYIGSKLMAATLLRLGDPAGASEVLGALRLDQINDPDLLALAGTAFMQTGDTARAAELLQRAAEIAPDRAALRAQLALGRLATGQTEAAIAELEQAVNLDTPLPEADSLLVFAYLREKRFEDAISAARKMAEKTPDSPVPHNMMSAAYVGLGKHREARRALRTALEMDSAFHVARLNLARLDIAADDLAGAQRHFDAVLNQDPQHEVALLGRARIAALQGNPAAELDWLERARATSEDALKPRLLLVRKHLDAGRTNKAMDVARELIAAFPDHPAALETWGSVQMANGRTADAIITFKRLTAALPNNAKADQLLAMALLRAERFIEAQVGLESLIARQPENVEAHVLLAATHLEQGHVDRAHALARKVQSEVPASPVGYQLEGDVERKRDDPVKAAQAYWAAYQKEPNSQRIRLAANMYLQAEQPERARQRLEEHLRNHDTDIQTRLLLAGQYQTTGNEPKAVEHYETILKQDPANTIALNNLAWLYHSAQDSRALSMAERAYRSAPDHPAVMDTYGWILLHQGEERRALKLLQESAVHSPDNAEIRYHRAVALYKNNHPAEAKKALTRLLREVSIFPNRSEAQALLQQLQE